MKQALLLKKKFEISLFESPDYLPLNLFDSAHYQTPILFNSLHGTEDSVRLSCTHQAPRAVFLKTSMNTMVQDTQRAELAEPC